MIANQTFAEIDQCPFFVDAPFDAILGLGYSPVPMGDGILTPLDHMYDQNLISQKMFTVYLNRDSNGDIEGGEIIFGGTDCKHCVGDFADIPLTNDGYWTIIVDALKINNQSISINTVGYVDAGSGLILMPPDQLAAINEAIGVTSDPVPIPELGPSASYYTVPCDQIENLPSVKFILNAKSFELQPTDYIFEVSKTTKLTSRVKFIFEFSFIPQR